MRYLICNICSWCNRQHARMYLLHMFDISGLFISSAFSCLCVIYLFLICLTKPIKHLWKTLMCCKQITLNMSVCDSLTCTFVFFTWQTSVDAVPSLLFHERIFVYNLFKICCLCVSREIHAIITCAITKRVVITLLTIMYFEAGMLKIHGLF